MNLEKAKAVFFELVANVPAEQWDARLAELAGDDEELRRRVSLLLAAHRDEGSFLDSPAAALGRTVDQPIHEAPGTVIGPYKLLEQIGEGGFGVVFMAEQMEPVRRKVALKILKPGMDTRQVVARFEAERQALAIMDHPNIAKVFDGGATPSGRPYFVMELVKGVPITEFCDQNHLTPRQRLELFVPVCQAVQHAHQKGIIHRDLKPSNVLVSRHDATPVVKVIDFGVAKALGQVLTDKTLFTGIAQMIGTPLYMSPEQAGMSDLDVDTRSDIYSLGVLLYELLTGSTPFSKERFKLAAYDEIRRIIREEEPPKPSTRLSDLGRSGEQVGRIANPSHNAAPTSSLASVSAQRQTEPVKLTKLMRGELDWIVMKALDKDRNRRYETANGFAMDVQRYLADEAVQACPPSAAYRLKKFARRNKAGLAVAALVLFFLVVLGSGVGWAVRDRSAREAEVARQQAERQAKAAGQVDSILAEVDRLEGEQKWPEALAAARRAEVAVASGEAEEETTERVRQRLKDLEFIDRLEQIRLQRAPLVDGKFDNSRTDREYTRAFRDYGVDVEEWAVEASIDRLKARPGLAIPLAAALDDWVDAQRLISDSDAVGWKPLVAVARGIDPEPLRDRLRATWGRPVSEVRDDLRRLAESINIRTQHPVTLVSLARALLLVKDSDSALRILRDAQYVWPGDFCLNYELSHALYKQKDHEGTIRYCTAAVSIRPQSAAAHNNLGVVLCEQKKLDEAIACHRKAIEIHPRFAAAYSNLGNALRDQKKLDEAIASYKKAIELDSEYVRAHINLGIVWKKQNKLDAAIDCFRTAIKLDPKNALAHNNLAIVLQDQGKLDDAIASYKMAITLEPEDAKRHYFLGRLLVKKGTQAEAIASFLKAIELNPKYASAFHDLGVAYTRLKKLDEAITSFRTAIEINPMNLEAIQNLATALNRKGDRAGAMQAYRQAIQLDPRNAQSLGNFAWHLTTIEDPKLRNPQEGLALARRSVAIAPAWWNMDTLSLAAFRCGEWKESLDTRLKMIKLQPARTEDKFFLSMNHWRLGDKDEARKWYTEATAEFAKLPKPDAWLTGIKKEAEALLGPDEQTPRERLTVPPRVVK